MNDERQPRSGWAVVEVMGHVTIAGYVTETTIAGAGVLAVAVPDGDRTVEQLISPTSLYRLTWVGEDEARLVARKHPVQVIDDWTIRQETRAQIEKEERDSIEQRVRRQVAIERAAEDRGLPPEATAVYGDAIAIHTDDDAGDYRDDDDEDEGRRW